MQLEIVLWSAPAEDGQSQKLGHISSSFETVPRKGEVLIVNGRFYEVASVAHEVMMARVIIAAVQQVDEEDDSVKPEEVPGLPKEERDLMTKLKRMEPSEATLQGMAQAGRYGE